MQPVTLVQGNHRPGDGGLAARRIDELLRRRGIIDVEVAHDEHASRCLEQRIDRERLFTVPDAVGILSCGESSNLTEPHEGRQIARIALEHLFEQLARSRHVAALVEQEHGLGDVVGGLERIDPARPVEQLERLVAPGGVLIEHRGEPRIALRGIRAQLQPATVVCLCGRQVVEVHQMPTLQVGIAVLRVELEGLRDQLLAVAERALESLLPIVSDFVFGDEDLRRGLIDIGVGELWVRAYGTLEMTDGVLRVDDAIIREQAAALQEGEIGVEVFGALPRQSIDCARIEAELECPRDLHGDLVLDFEDVTGRAVEAHRPDIRARLRVDQLRRYPHPGAIALHAALEQVAGAELATDLARIGLAVPERERGGARDDVELGEVRELVQDGLGDAHRKHLAVRSTYSGSETAAPRSPGWPSRYRRDSIAGPAARRPRPAARR